VTAATNPRPDVPLPAGAEWADDWEDDPDRPWRIVTGCPLGLGNDGSAAIVRAVAVQYADGGIDFGDDAPRVDIPRLADAGFNSVDARSLAQMILAAADQVDLWTAAAAEGAGSE
jgi:hypothetical protein